MMFEMRRKQEEQRQKELEERKRKEAEAKRERLEEAEKKRLAMQQAIKQRDEAARRNFMVKKTAPGANESGPIVFGMQDGKFEKSILTNRSSAYEMANNITFACAK